MKTLPVILLFLCISLVSTAQSKLNEQPLTDRESKIGFSISNGLLFSQTGNSISRGLETSGFDKAHLRKSRDFVGGKVYTYKVKSRAAWTYELTFNPNNRHSFNLAYGKLFHQEFLGRDDSNPYVIYGTSATSLELEHQLKCISLYYTRSFNHNRHALGLGPQLGIYRMEQNFEKNTNTKKVIPGLRFSHTINFIADNNLMLGLRTVYYLFMPMTIGPYEKSTQHYDMNIPHTFTSVFQETKIPLSALKLEIMFAWKFNVQ